LDFPISPESADQELFNMLKALRKKIAKKEGVAPHHIFEDPVLNEMAIHYPITMEELLKISGVNEVKAKKYGPEFLEIIKNYVEQKDIIRPSDIVVKVPKKSGNKVLEFDTVKLYTRKNFKVIIGLIDKSRMSKL